MFWGQIFLKAIIQHIQSPINYCDVFVSHNGRITCIELTIQLGTFENGIKYKICPQGLEISRSRRSIYRDKQKDLGRVRFSTTKPIHKHHKSNAKQEGIAQNFLGQKDKSGVPHMMTKVTRIWGTKILEERSQWRSYSEMFSQSMFTGLLERTKFISWETNKVNEDFGDLLILEDKNGTI